MRSATDIGRRSCRAGATLVEVLVSVLLFAIGYACISGTCSACMAIVRQQRETMAAAQLLQERMESLQAAGWRQLTDGPALSQGVMAIESSHVGYLRNATESIEVNIYPAVTPALTPLKVQRRAGVATVVSTPPNGISLRQLLAVKITVRVQWTTDKERTRSRELASVVALGGLLQ